VARQSGNDHLKAIAQARAAQTRLEDELALTKANLKVAKENMRAAINGAADYAEKQLAFDLAPTE